jgi:hypothetical protein
VPQDLWNIVHEKNMSFTRDQKKRLGGPSGKYLLSGLLKCSVCGSSYIVSNSGKYHALICNGYWSRGAAVCDCKHKLLMSSAENLLLSKISKLIRKKTTISKLTRMTNAKLKELSLDPRMDKKKLLSEKQELNRKIENLLNLAEATGVSTQITERIKENETKLTSIEESLAKINQHKASFKAIKEPWLKDKLDNLSAVLEPGHEDTGRINKVLKNLIPGKLSVKTIRNGKKVSFHIKGLVMPFNALAQTASPIMLSSPTGNRTPV